MLYVHTQIYVSRQDRPGQGSRRHEVVEAVTAKVVFAHRHRVRVTRTHPVKVEDGTGRQRLEYYSLYSSCPHCHRLIPTKTPSLQQILGSDVIDLDQYPSDCPGISDETETLLVMRGWKLTVRFLWLRPTKMLRSLGYYSSRTRESFTIHVSDHATIEATSPGLYQKRSSRGRE